MDSLISTFHIDWKLIVAQMVNFAIVFAVLYWFALKPLAKLMAERKSEIEKGLTDAKTNADTLVNTKKEYADALAQARREGSEYILSAKKNAEKEGEQIILSAQAKAKLIITNTEVEIEALRTKMTDEFKKDMAGLVISATEKVLEGTVKGNVESALVEKSIKEVSAV